MCPTANLDVVKIKISPPCRESKTGSLIVQPLGQLLYLLSYHGFLSYVSIELFLLAGRTDSSPPKQKTGSGSYFKRAQYTSNVQILFPLEFLFNTGLARVEFQPDLFHKVIHANFCISTCPSLLIFFHLISLTKTGRCKVCYATLYFPLVISFVRLHYMEATER